MDLMIIWLRERDGQHIEWSYWLAGLHC